MQILLVKPKAVLGPVLGLEAFQRLEPIELGYLAAVVPPEHRVVVLDLRLTRWPWWALDRALAAAPDLVGITGYTHESSAVKAIARRVRELGIAVHAAFMVEPEFGEYDFDGLAAFVAGMPPAQCSFTVRTPSPGTADYRDMRPWMWVERPYDLHDCMHPLTPTELPLRRFAERRSPTRRAPASPRHRCEPRAGRCGRWTRSGWSWPGGATTAATATSTASTRSNCGGQGGEWNLRNTRSGIPCDG